MNTNTGSESYTKDIIQRGNILVVATCRTCPHSTKFKDNLEKIKQLANANRLIYVYVEFSSTDNRENLIIETCPKIDLKPYIIRGLPITHFPSMMIVPKETWLHNTSFNVNEFTGNYVVSEIEEWVVNYQNNSVPETTVENKDMSQWSHVLVVATCRTCPPSKIGENLEAIKQIAYANKLVYMYIDSKASVLDAGPCKIEMYPEIPFHSWSISRLPVKKFPNIMIVPKKDLLSPPVGMISVNEFTGNYVVSEIEEWIISCQNIIEDKNEDIIQRGNILVVATCRTCPHSKIVQENLEAIKQIANTNKLVYVHLDYSSTNTISDPIIETCPKINFDSWAVRRIQVNHFPSLMIVPSATWLSCTSSVIHTFTGSYVTVTEIEAWVQKILAHEYIIEAKKAEKNKDVCLLITLKTCPHSKSVLDKLSTIKSIISANNLDYQHNSFTNAYEYEIMESTLNRTTVAHTLKNVIKVFPTLMIIPYDAWMLDQITADRISVYGCEPGKLQPASNYPAYSYDAIEAWIISHQKVVTSQDSNLISAIQETQKHISKSKIEKISSQIIRLKQDKKQLEHKIHELEELESMLKTLQACSDQQLRQFLDGAENGWNLTSTNNKPSKSCQNPKNI